ncbi:MAG: hypothetical protein US70_C0010G0038, partial [Parcubacteria group bacterium GW2011_GWD2_38_11]
THDSNKTGWTKYFSKDENVATGNDLKLSAITASATQTSDIDFNTGTKSNTAVDSSGSSAVVALAESGNFDSYTELMLHGDATGSAIVDSQTPAKTINVYGDTTQSATQSKFGGKSIYFDGVGDYLTFPASEDFNIGTGDFTIDSWVYISGNPSADGATVFSCNGGEYAWNTYPGGCDLFYVGGAFYFMGSDTVNMAVGASQNAWHHVAIVRSGSGSNNLKLYVDGIMGAQRTFNGAVGSSLGRAAISRMDDVNTNGGRGFLTGYIDEFRLSKGIARWTSDFSVFSSAYKSSYVGSGTFESSVINTGQKSSFTILSYNFNVPASTNIAIDVRAGNTIVPDGSWTAWQTGVNNSGDISGLSGNQYVQYRANFTTSDASVTPQLNDVTFNYKSYPKNQTASASIDFNLANEANFVQQDNTKTLFSTSTASLEPALDTVNDLTNGLGGSATALNSYSVGRTPDMAFNEVLAGDTGAAWLSATSPAWISIDLGKNVMVQRMKLIARQSEGNRFPTSMTLYGSFNNTDFVSIASMNYNGVWEWNTFNFANNVDYRYYKLLCSSSGSEVGIAEIEYYGATAYPTTQSYYVTTSATSQKNSSTWGAISGVTLSQTTPANTTLKYLVSFDNRSTWKYWNGSSWVNSSLANLETDGMTKSIMEGISQVQWGASGGFVPLSGTLDFAVSLKTTDAAVTPTVGSINVNYELLPPALISSPYDTSSQANVLSKILWTENLPAQTDIKLQLRSSANGSVWTSWMGTDGTDLTYFTAPDGSETLPTALTDSTNDQWIQYKAFVTTADTSVTPTLSDVSLKYVVNAKPEFNPDFPTTGVGGMSAVQNESGSVVIDFSVRDPDTTEGTATPNLLTPSYYYSLNNGVSYTQIVSGLSAGASNPKTVEEVNFLDYSVTWNATEQLGNNINIADAKIRVVVTDNEAGPNTTQKDSSAFTLNTMIPVLGAVPIKVDASVTPAIVTMDATDATPLEMKVSTSPTLVGASWEPYTATKEITLASTPATVYFQVKNANSFTSVISSATTPEVPASAMVQDTSNLNITPSEFRLFVAWKVAALPDPGFGSYKIYRSVDQNDWTLIDTIPSRLTNYYGDNSVSGDTNYYYKVTTNDSNGSISAYSSIVNGKANGIQDAGEGGGGTTPSTEPIISAVSITGITSTSALVSWDTDTLSNSMVAYIDETGGDFSDAKMQGVMSVANNAGGIGKHNLTLTNLSPNKTYYLKLQSADASGRVGESVQGTDGYSFTTADGPAITNVEIMVLGENEARINWTTNKSVPSIVSYAENHIGATLTEPIVFEDQKKETTHSKIISNLTRGIPYYFTIKAVDDDGGESLADNAGLLYNFTTDIDTAGPTITSVLSPMVTINQAAITWVTDEDATSQVKYSISAGGPYTTLTEEVTLQKGHTYIISDLDNANPKYYYKVISKDIYGSGTTSAEYFFDMPLDASLNHPPLETITFEDVNPSMLTDTAAVISFATDQIANCFVEYGTSPDSYTYVPVQEKTDTYNKSHAIALTGMLFSTKHYYKVTCQDNLPDAVAISSEEKDFTTLDKLISQSSVGGFDILPPTISNVKVADIIGEGVTITWNTDEKGSSSVGFGISAANENVSGDQVVNEDKDNYATSHTVILNGLIPATKYLFKATSLDAAGNISQSSESSFTTASPSSLSSIKVESKNLGTATVSWQTDQETTSTVEYGLSTSYGDKKENNSFTTEHSINLSNLNQGVVYHYRVKGEDKDGRLFASSDQTFEPKSPAKISDIAINDVNEHGAIVTFKTNVPTDANVTYTDIKDGMKTGAQGARELTIDHKIELTNLDQGSTFAITIAVRDEQGTEATIKVPDLTTGKDENPPKIDNVKTDSALTQSDKVQAIISWKTDEQATSSILYKEGRSGDEKEIKITDNLTTGHVGVVTIFKPGTVYNFKVKSIDASGNIAISNDFALLTPKRRENIIQIIIGNFTDIFGWAKF